MGTNQSEFGNVDGATYFYFYTSGSPLYDYDPGDEVRDGCHGLRLFAESRDYAVEGNFTQLIKGGGTDPTKGFTFDDFVEEIDGGWPVLVHLEDHTVLGYGYSSTGSTIYIHDTMDYESHTMTWGGTYDGASQWGVSVLRLSPVVTEEATEVAAYSVTLNGRLISLAGETSVEASFEYGVIPGTYTHTTSSQLLTSPGELIVDVSGLSGFTTYYYRARISNGESFFYGIERDFTTLTAPPEVTTEDASLVTTSSAALNGRLTSLGTAPEVDVYFEWGTSSGSYSGQTVAVTMMNGGTFSADLTGLAPGTTYHFRAVADGHDADFGQEVVFTTKTLPPVVFTLEASDISVDSGRLNGRLVSLGTAPFAEVFFEWGIAPGVYTESSTAEILDTTGYFSVDVGGYAPGTTCYFRACAVGHGTGYGPEDYFTTATERPEVGNAEAMEIGTHTALVNGSLLSLGTAPTVSVLFQYGTIPGVYWFETPVQIMTETGEWSSEIEGLSPGTTYYCRAKASGHGTAYGEQEANFTTHTLPPVVTSPEATEMGPHTAVLYTEVSALGTADSVEVSFEYGTDTADYRYETLPKTKTEAGAVSISLVDLTPGTTYYFRAKAAGHGIEYSEERVFTTSTTPPSLGVVEQTSSSSSTPPSVSITGQLISLGTASSVLLSVELAAVAGGPYEVAGTEVMTSPGAFAFEIGDLAPDQAYYCRVKADGGEHGLTYGSEVTLSIAGSSFDWTLVGAGIVGATLAALVSTVFVRAIRGRRGRW